MVADRQDGGLGAASYVALLEHVAEQARVAVTAHRCAGSRRGTLALADLLTAVEDLEAWRQELGAATVAAAGEDDRGLRLRPYDPPADERGFGWRAN